MLEDGHWLFPTLDGQPYAIKPPLFNWLGSLLSLPGGEVTELTSRLPSAIAAFVGLFLIYGLGRRLFGWRAGLLAAVVLGTTPLYIEFGRWIQINAIACTLLVATLLLFHWGYSNERRRTLAYVLMYVPVALGTLNMGPVAAVMPTIVIGGYLLARGDPWHVLQLRIVRGLLVYLAIALPWYLAVSLREGYAQDLLVETNFSRYFTAWQHVKPFHYYLGKAPLYFLPWTLYLPAVAVLWRARKWDRAGLVLPIVWVLGLLLFFSFSRTKRIGYLLPAYPALALLVGYALDRALLEGEDSELWRRWIAWPSYGLLVGVAATGIGLPAWCALYAPDWLPAVAPLGALLVAGSGVACALLWRGSGAPALAALVLLIAGGVGWVAGPVVAKVNEIKSPKPFALKVDAALQSGEPLRFFRTYSRYIQFYGSERRPVEIALTPEELLEWFRSDVPVYVVAKEKDYLRIRDTFPEPIHVAIREWVDHRHLVVMSNRAP
jgi:4-amino-4-deoxy-L-arabinose transferase-like glycosyltransferase